MRVAFVLREFPVLSETFILNQITGLIDQGYEVDIFADRPREKGKYHPSVDHYQLLKRTHYWAAPKNKLKKLFQLPLFLAINYHKNPYAFRQALNSQINPSFSTRISLFYKVVALLKNPEYDIIKCHFGYNGNLAAQLLEMKAIRGRIVTTFHGFDITKEVESHGHDMYSDLFKAGDLCLAISQKWQEKLINLGCSPEKTRLHRLGIDLETLKYSPDHFSSTDQVQLLSIARLVEKKGIEYGIRAMKIALQKHPKITYKIVGEGHLRPYLKDLINKLDLQENIFLVGPKAHDEVLEFLHNSDILIAPSITTKEGDQEGIPITLMEAMALGRPVISTWHSGIPELVEDGNSGFLVQERDIEALAERIVQLAKDIELRRKMGYEGRKRIEMHYSLENSNKKLASFFESLLAPA